MAHLTPDEAQRIIRACTDVSGLTSRTLLAGWKAIVLEILDRLEMRGEDAHALPLARKVVLLWASVEAARLYPPGHEFLYEADEVDKVRCLYGQLNRLMLEAVRRFMVQPPADPEWERRALGHFEDIQWHIADRLRMLDEMKRRGGMFYVTADEMRAILEACMTILGIVLGATHGESFRAQYDTCMVPWTSTTQLLRRPRGGLN